MAAVKFSSKMDPQVLDEMRVLAAEQGRTLSAVLTEASAEYLARASVRPAFRDASTEVLDTHADLLERLAK